MQRCDPPKQGQTNWVSILHVQVCRMLDHATGDSGSSVISPVMVGAACTWQLFNLCAKVRHIHA